MMQGLLDFIKTPEGQGLLAGAFGYAANAQRGAPINSIGRGGLAGLLGYSNALERQDQQAENQWMQKYRQMQMDKAQYDMDRTKSADAEATRVREIMRNAFTPVSGAQAIGVDGRGPTPDKTPLIGQLPKVNFQELLAQGVPLEQVKAMAEAQNLGRSKVKNIETISIDGKPMRVGVDEFGQQVAQIGMEWKPLERVDAGGYVGVYDPTNPMGGVRKLVDKTMTPEGRDASARGWATVSQGERRLELDKGQNAYTFNAELGGYVPKNPGGQFVPLDGVSKSPKLTESEGKNTLYLSQMREASSALAGAKGASPMSVAMTDSPYTNWMVGDDSQRAAQAQRQWSEAYLRAKTGAAATAGEVENNIRTFFPVVGDSEATIKRKSEARAQAEKDMEIPAGRGAARAAEGSTKQIKRTGTYNGRKVIEYTDGSTAYAD